MKKSLSLLLAVAMVFSMFASAALAADAELTAQQKFDALKEANIFAGKGDGEADLLSNMKRSEFARIAGLLAGLDVEATPTTLSFDDVAANHWAVEEIEAAVKAEILAGKGDRRFDPDGEVKIQELAVVIVKLLGLEPVEGAEVEGADAWAGPYVQALLDKGIALPTNYTEPATRGVLVEASYVAYTALNPNVSDLAVSSVAQSGAKKIAVNFNRAVTDAEAADLTVDVKYGFVPYSPTLKWADDKNVLTLEFSFLPAGDYTVEVKGFEAQTIKVEAEKVSAIEIGANALQKAAGQDLKVKALNQFGEEMVGQLSDGNVSVYNGSQGKDLKTVIVGGNNVYSNFKLDLSDDAAAKADDVIVVTVTHPTTGLSATKNFKVTAASAISSMTFGPVAPLKDKTRITVEDENIEIPYTLVDQYGDSIKLANSAASATHGDLTFYSSNDAIVDPANFKVEDGKLIITQIGSTAGTAIITVVNSKAGLTTTFNIVVSDTAKVKTFVLNHPGQLIAVGDSVKIPFQATDSFGAVIDAKEFGKAATNGQVTISSGNPAVTISSTSWDAKTGELTLEFGAKGQTTVYAWVGGQIASQISVNVLEAATPEKVTGIKDVNTLFAPEGTFTLDFKKNIIAVDNYGRPLDSHAFTATVKEGNTDVVKVNGGNQIEAVAAGTRTIVVALDGVADSSFEFTVRVIAAKDVVSFELNAIPDLYSKSNGADGYVKAFTLVGKDANGNKVNIKQSEFYTSVTSSNPSVLSTSVTGSVYGQAKGTATVTVWNGASKIAEAEVNVTDAAPIATTVKFAKADYTVTHVAPGATLALAGELTVEDQYGVAFAKNGTWASSDKSVAEVSASGVVTTKKAGEVTISYVSVNGVVATTVVNVN